MTTPTRHLLLLCLMLPALAAAPRARYDFNPAWKVHVGDVAGAEAPVFDDAAPPRGRGGINIQELTNVRDPAASGVGSPGVAPLSIAEIEIYAAGK